MLEEMYEWNFDKKFILKFKGCSHKYVEWSNGTGWDSLGRVKWICTRLWNPNVLVRNVLCWGDWVVVTREAGEPWRPWSVTKSKGWWNSRWKWLTHWMVLSTKKMWTEKYPFKWTNQGSLGGTKTQLECVDELGRSMKLKQPKYTILWKPV